MGTEMTGSSMASAHVAGAAALLRQANPTLSPEQIKAILMNTATHDLYTAANHGGARYCLARTGGGRVDLNNAIAAHARAYNYDDRGMVSLSFGALEAVGTLQVEKHLRITNTSSSILSYALTYDSVVDLPGVEISFPNGNAVNVPAKASYDVTVRLTATASLIKHVMDPSLSPTQGGYAREWLNEESGHVVLTPVGALGEPNLWVPLHANVRPAGTLVANKKTFKLAPTPLSLKFSGQAVNTGTNYPTDDVGLLYPYDLQYSSPQNTSIYWEEAKPLDLQHIGVHITPNADFAKTTLDFGISTWSSWATPNECEFVVNIDTDKDGTMDYIIINYNLGTYMSAPPSDVLFSICINQVTYRGSMCGWLNFFQPQQKHTVPFRTNVIHLPVSASNIGLTESQSSFNFSVSSYLAQSYFVDETPMLTYDAKKPGFAVDVSYPDETGTKSFPFSRANLKANNSLGLLLLHHHNSAATRAEAILISAGAEGWQNYK